MAGKVVFINVSSQNVMDVRSQKGNRNYSGEKHLDGEASFFSILPNLLFSSLGHLKLKCR